MSIGLEVTMRQINQEEQQHEIIIKRIARHGQATVEFALVVVVLLTVLYGIIEISRLLIVSVQLDNAAREGVHYAAIHPGVDKGCIRKAIVAPKLVLVDTSTDTSNPPLDVDIYLNQQTSGQNIIRPFYPITVTVNYTWTTVVNIMPDRFKSVRLHASAVAMIESPDSNPYTDKCPQPPPP